KPSRQQRFEFRGLRGGGKVFRPGREVAARPVDGAREQQFRVEPRAFAVRCQRRGRLGQQLCEGSCRHRRMISCRAGRCRWCIMHAPARQPSTRYCTDSAMKVYRNVLEMIGRTPMIELTHLDTGPCRLFAKLELANPGASVKD